MQSGSYRWTRKSMSDQYDGISPMHLIGRSTDTQLAIQNHLLRAQLAEAQRTIAELEKRIYELKEEIRNSHEYDWGV